MPESTPDTQNLHPPSAPQRVSAPAAKEAAFRWVPIRSLSERHRICWDWSHTTATCALVTPPAMPRSDAM